MHALHEYVNFEPFWVNTSCVLGWIILFPLMSAMLRMMDSMNKYYIKETDDTHLLSNRIEDLENDMVILKRLLGDFTKEFSDKEYVDMVKYNKDKFELKDTITINQKDILQMKKQIADLENKDYALM
tara:strand:+ start:138 stop:518 length:381 start_codon:yes stop_codon:yes gene_type:complete